MTEKRFTINNSNIVQDGYFIKDNVGSFSFPTTSSGSDLIMYQKALNKLEKENEQLKEELEDAKLDVKIYKNANATFDNVYQENEQLKQRIKELEIENEAQSDAIDGLQEFMTHHNLEELE